MEKYLRDKINDNETKHIIFTRIYTTKIMTLDKVAIHSGLAGVVPVFSIASQCPHKVFGMANCPGI